MHEHDGGRQERAVRGERWIDQEPEAFVDEDTDGRVGVRVVWWGSCVLGGGGCVVESQGGVTSVNACMVKFELLTYR